MRARWRALVERNRHAVEAAADCLAWMTAVPLAVILRYEFDVLRINLAGLAGLTVIAMLAQAVAGTRIGLYLGRWRYGSFEEVAQLAKSAAATTAVITGVNVIVSFSATQLVPRTTTLTSGALALVSMSAVRYSWRFARELRSRPSEDTAERLIVFGAGEGGAQVITAMLRGSDSPYVPVALLDDDTRKSQLRIGAVRVMGNRHDIADVARQTHADALLIAIPSATGELIAELTDLAQAARLDVKVLPPARELFGAPDVSDIRELNPADLLGRHEVDTDLASIADYLTNKRVLVTGAGGSIGAELCRQIWRFAPAELMMLDRDETALHGVQLSIEGRALLDSPGLILADIRDAKRLETIFEQRRPQVVFHAAALKHLTLLERHPSEALQTNVVGTLNVLLASAWSGVERFVNISTDKAADPTSVLGYSKRIAERLTTYITQQTSGTYLSVRFGNVLGSRGSMLGTFEAQIAAGGPVTVTHPDVTRFFMTIQEACELVIQAGAVGNDGESLVLDMGEPIRIADVARRLVAQAPRRVQIVYTGLRPGEKLHEALLGTGEPDVRPVHPLISHVAVPPLPPAAVLALAADGEEQGLVDELRDLAYSLASSDA